jgi:hypothetical protein
MMTPPHLLIEHVYLRDRYRIVYDENGVEIGRILFVVPPGCDDCWEIFDFSPDSKTGWRRISLGGWVA